ncbi:MAG: hypothetical protein FJ260_09620 [Planctomycetes bacterium]|nr:hypothetical protein [Planctomycetota bacterium]
MIAVPDPPPLDVQRELAAMRAELAAIRVQERDRWLDEARAQSVRDIVRDALSDSATRASFLSADWTAGLSSVDGTGVFLRANDGTASIQLNGMVQTRFVAASAYGTDTSGATGTNSRWGFETKTVFVSLAGNLVDPSLTYVAVVAYTAQSNRFIVVPGQYRLVYARIRKDLGEGWAVGAGLLNVPWDLESDYIGSSRLTVGDYSIFNYRFGAGKQPGVVGGWTGDWFRAAAGAFNQINTIFPGWNAAQNLSFAVAGRAEMKWGIDWKQIAGMTGASSDASGLVLGLGLCMSNGRAQNPQPPASSLATPSAQGVTADARVLLGPTVLIGQYAYMRDPVGGPELGWYHGVNVQASTYVLPQVEAFAEACWMGDVPVEWIAQAGFNWFIDGNRVRLTSKVVVPFGGGNVNGIRNIAGGLGIMAADNNASVIAQLQVMF